MNANEFWCKAFLAAMGEAYREILQGTNRENHDWPAAYAGRAADAALSVAQRRGMVTVERAAPGPQLERVEFTAELDGDIWTLCAPGWTSGVQVRTGGERYPFGPIDTLFIKWGESSPPKPIEVWIERR